MYQMLFILNDCNLSVLLTNKLETFLRHSVVTFIIPVKNDDHTWTTCICWNSKNRQWTV